MADRRRRRRGFRQRLGGDDFQGKAGGVGDYLLALFRSGAEASSDVKSILDRWCPTVTTSSPP